MKSTVIKELVPKQNYAESASWRRRVGNVQIREITPLDRSSSSKIGSP